MPNNYMGNVFLDKLVNADMKCFDFIVRALHEEDYEYVSGALFRANALKITGDNLYTVYVNCGSNIKNAIKNLNELSADSLYKLCQLKMLNEKGVNKYAN